MEQNLLLAILLLPCVGFLVNYLLVPTLFGESGKDNALLTGSIATFFVALSFVASVVLFLQFQSDLSMPLLNWFAMGEYRFQFGLDYNRISALLVMIITGIGALVHLFSIAYMHHEESVHRYFAFLNLFCFMMLVLVLSDSLLFTFFGWEGVGLCSYLLIGFWYQKEQYVEFARKAFVMNRVGDVGFVFGLFILFYYFRTDNYAAMYALYQSQQGMDHTIAILAAGFLFFGATGKSAQIPLFTWLPDAMVGPTPVSALIHAATMVTAGIFLCSKLHFVFSAAPEVMTVISYIGIGTALIGAVIALAQNDIKKVLAYSTVSQLGFMFVAIGVGAYKTAIFHLMTHAFFKALLFLCSGSVIHGCEGEQDMRQMGGLKKKMPLTFVTMTIGFFALSGLPFFSGYFSKDEILYMASGNQILFLGGLMASACTAFYSGRVIKMTFFDQYRGQAHVHEAPVLMMIPQIILAILAIFGGLMSIPHGFLGMHLPNLLDQYFMQPELFVKLHSEGILLSESLISWIASINAMIFLFAGFKFAHAGVTKWSLLQNKLYIDEMYQVVLLRPLSYLENFCKFIVENMFFQSINGVVGSGVKTIGVVSQKIQSTGYVKVQLVFAFVSIAMISLYWFFA